MITGTKKRKKQGQKRIRKDKTPGPGSFRKCWLCVAHGESDGDKNRLQMKWSDELGELDWADGHADNSCPSLQGGRATVEQAAAAKKAWSMARSKRSPYLRFTKESLPGAAVEQGAPLARRSRPAHAVRHDHAAIGAANGVGNFGVDFTAAHSAESSPPPQPPLASALGSTATAAASRGADDPRADGAGADNFEVESILQSRKRSGKPFREYLVAWKGHDATANSWEPEPSLVGGARESIAAFNDAQDRQREKTARLEKLAQKKHFPNSVVLVGS